MLPYNEEDIVSVYHVREYDVHKLLQVQEPIDIFLSHDWPLGITDCGDSESLVWQKPFFRQEVLLVLVCIDFNYIAFNLFLLCKDQQFYICAWCL